MFTLAFRFGLRIGEMTRSPHNLLLRQITLDYPVLTVHFSSFKHSTPNPLPHKIQADPFNLLCPVRHLITYLKLRGNVEGPFFILDGQPVSQKFFNTQLKNLILLIGEDADRYSSHSFRIGSATLWAHQGKSDAQMRQLGRWNSNALDKYIREPVDHSL